jgi:DNA-binding IclR family transcriptional regulator
VPKVQSSGGGKGAKSATIVKSADRVLTLFEFLSRWGRDMSHTEIAEFLKIPKSSLTQLLRNLVDRGWLAYSPRTKGYHLGDAIKEIARAATEVEDSITLVQPILAALTAATRQTSALNVLHGDTAETVATVLGTEVLLATMRVGQRSPLFSTSYGKMLLAHMPVEMREDYLARVEFQAMTPKTVRSAEELRIQMVTIQREGIAYSFEEHIVGIVGTARPVFGPNGNVIGAISVACAASRYDAALHTLISAELEKAVTDLSGALRLLPAHQAASAAPRP